MAAVERFGVDPEGGEVARVRIEGGGLTAWVLTWGAVVQDMRLAGHAPPLVLGFREFTDYPAHSPYFGAIVGWFANRIAGARFTLDGREWRLEPNYLGRHQLHGGSRGFGRRNWSLAGQGADFVTLELVSEDGDMGYPGRLVARCTYRVAGGALRVELSATSDAPTVCNLAHHGYFNLDDGGAEPVLGHRLEIRAESWLPVDADLIPTGERRPVAGTDHDFRVSRPMGREVAGMPVLYDHTFCLSETRTALRPVARVLAERSGIGMEVATTEPGVQFYAAQRLSVAVPGLDGIRYGPSSGFCLETQVWPDAPNRPHFPSAVLRPGETLRQVTEYRFARAWRMSAKSGYRFWDKDMRERKPLDRAMALKDRNTV